jgi:hypothetical protein
VRSERRQTSVGHDQPAQFLQTPHPASNMAICCLQNLGTQRRKTGIMSSPAGWYPQSDGQQRYWDGELWTEHFAPGVPVETSALPLVKPKQLTFGGRSFSKAASFGWGGLALTVLLGALSGGFSGAAVMLGWFALVVGVIALARGRVGWARLASRAAGGVAVGAAVVLLIVGVATEAPSMSPTSKSTNASSDPPPTADSAAEAAAQAAAAETAAAEVAAAEAAAAAEKASAEASAQAASDAATAQASADAATAKATADAVAAKNAKAAAAKKARAVAAASAKAAAAAAAAAVVPPPAADVYYANCTEARAAGVTPIMRGEPGYASKLDRDNDGIACE